jgi:hypothetical protein
MLMRWNNSVRVDLVVVVVETSLLTSGGDMVKLQCHIINVEDSDGTRDAQCHVAEKAYFSETSGIQWMPVKDKRRNKKEKRMLSLSLF